MCVVNLLLFRLSFFSISVLDENVFGLECKVRLLVFEVDLKSETRFHLAPTQLYYKRTLNQCKVPVQWTFGERAVLVAQTKRPTKRPLGCR